MKTLILMLVACAIIAGTAINTKAANPLSEGSKSIGGGVVASMPIGNFGDAANTGFGVRGSFQYFFAHLFAFQATLAYISYSTDSDDVSFSNIPLLFGISYYIALNQALFLYLAANVGLNFVSASVDLGIYGSGSNSNTKFGFSPAAGLLIPMTTSIALLPYLQLNMVDEYNSLGINFKVMFNLK